MLLPISQYNFISSLLTDLIAWILAVTIRDLISFKNVLYSLPIIFSIISPLNFLRWWFRLLSDRIIHTPDGRFGVRILWLGLVCLDFIVFFNLYLFLNEIQFHNFLWIQFLLSSVHTKGQLYRLFYQLTFLISRFYIP